MDAEYDRKFEEMKKYIPFLESMINRLENTNATTSNPRQAQLNKIRSLRDLLMDKKKRMKMENLLKCEQVLVNLYAKVEQRDALPGIKPASDPTFQNSNKQKEETQLDIVRNKLKNVTTKQLEDEQENFEIARASGIEEICALGSKEPALFQRRPNSAVPSTVPQSPNKSSATTLAKRNYTRVLVSPEPETRRWDTEETFSEKPLFSRRSPRRSPKRRSPSKKERKKFKQSRKGKGLNITLSVPQDSLDSLNTKDILTRIMNCSDSDVDIDMLREAKRQILNELKHTGANCDDISDLLLKSYKKKKTKQKTEVEEGELSDSESEAIESIYGSFMLDAGDKEGSTSKDSDNKDVARKIKICLVINSDKDNTSNDLVQENFYEDVACVDFEMYDEKLNLSLTKNKNTADVKTLTKGDEKSNVANVLADKDSDACTLISEKTNLESPKENTESNKKTDKTDDNCKLETFCEPVSEGNDNTNESSTLINSNTCELSEMNFCSNQPSEAENTKSVGEKRPDISAYLKSIPSTSLGNVEIPLLNEPSVSTTHNPEKCIVSEIDILQALKNEILSESLSMPVSEVILPSLHQPKLTKVSFVQELATKKRISIEKYKEKAVTAVPNTVTPLYFPDTSSSGKEDPSKKQSLKLTERECERFKLPSKLDLGEEDISDDDIDQTGLDNIYENLAPKSPEHNEINSSVKTLPVIIPSDPVKPAIAPTKQDVDMRTLIPKISPNVPLNKASPTDVAKHDLGSSTQLTKIKNNDQIKTQLESHGRRDSLVANVVNSPRHALNSEVPRPVPPPDFNQIKKPVALLKTPPTPNVITSITTTRVPPPLMMQSRTPNARGYEIPNIESNKYTYPPSLFDSQEREQTVTRDQRSRSYWDPNQVNEKELRKSGWEDLRELNYDTRSMQRDIHDYQNQQFNNSYNSYINSRYNSNERRNSFNRLECPQTPVHSYGRLDAPMIPMPLFGMSDCPPTPNHQFVRSDCPLTPSHPLGRSDCPPTPNHPFGRSDCPPTPSHPFGRECPPTPNHPFGRSDCPPTPNHPFGRSDCPPTPNHPFGRSDCPTTPIHPFGRMDMPGTTSHPFGRSDTQIHRDPRLIRNSDYDYQREDRDRNYHRDHINHNITYMQSYGHSENYGNYNELSVGGNERTHDLSGRQLNNRDRGSRREPSVGRPREMENDRYSNDRKYIGMANDYSENENSRSSSDYGSTGNYQPARSLGRHMSIDNKTQRSRARSMGRTRPKDKLVHKKESITSHAGRSFTIDTSVNSTFQDFLNSRPEDEQSNLKFDVRRRRASSVGRHLYHDSDNTFFNQNANVRRSFNREMSVGRSLYREQSVSRSLSHMSKPVKESHDFVDNSKSNNFRRAASMGREILNSKMERSFKDIKAEFEMFQSKLNIETKAKINEKSSSSLDSKKQSQRSKKDKYEKKITAKSEKISYSPRKNYRDPRVRRDIDFKNRRKQENSKEKEKKNIGIVYTNDNITKGTILGTGYGVKNYKIPKIKRPDQGKKEVEIEKVVKNKKDIESNNDNKETTNKKDEPISIKDAKKIIKDVKNATKKITRSPLENTKRRVTRSTRSTGRLLSEDDEDENILRCRKLKKPVIFDSDSDTEDHKKIIEKVSSKTPVVLVTKSIINIEKYVKKDKQNFDQVKENIVKESSPDNFEKDKKNCDQVEENIVKESSSDNVEKHKNISDQVEENIVKENLLDNVEKDKKNYDQVEENIVKETPPDIAEPKPNNVEDKLSEQLNSSFSVDDLFPDNMTEPVIDDLSNLIADLDNDIEPNKMVSPTNLNNDIAIENILKSPVISGEEQNGNLEGISEALKDDIARSKLNTNNIFKENLADNIKEVISEGCLDSVPAISLENSSQLKNIVTDPDSNHTKNLETNEETANENIVSTTEFSDKNHVIPPSEQQLNNNNDQSNMCGNSTPDSTNEIEINNFNQPGLADSTNEVSNEMPSIVTSSLTIDEISCKENTELSSSSKEPVPTTDSVGSILSLLQDKSKIKEILSMLGDKYSENEKIKKKLEKFSALVSDEENSDNETSSKDEQKQGSLPELKNKDAELLIKDDESTDADLKVANTTIVNSAVDKLSHEIKKIDTKDIEKEVIECDVKNVNENKILPPNKPPKKVAAKSSKVLKRGRKKIVRQVSGTGKRLTRSGAANQQVGKPTVKKPNRELLKLHEDIKEMFISDDVLNATGLRMCRLAKLVDDQKKDETSTQDSPEMVVVLEKISSSDTTDESPEKSVRKKHTQKPKPKLSYSADIESDASKSSTKYKPGPKSKTKAQKSNEDPYAFESDSFSDNFKSNYDIEHASSDSENESLTSSKSFSSSDVPLEKKKLKRKKSAWQSGIIKPKNRKKKTESKTTEPTVVDNIPVQGKTSNMPVNCFIDKTYCFEKNVFIYDCRLCTYNGDDIVNHYKQHHPHSEIPLSRLSVKMAKEAIEQCEEVNFQAISKIPTDKYVCRFCYKEFGGNMKKCNVLETFFWHVVSMHTGEFKQLCSLCNDIEKCPFILDIPPPPKDVKGQLIGYICEKCNFTQISLENLKTHVIERHNDELTEVFTINLAVMTKKTINEITKQLNTYDCTNEHKERVLRSKRSNQIMTELSDDNSDATSSDVSNGTLSLNRKRAKKTTENDEYEKLTEVIYQSKISFETDDKSTKISKSGACYHIKVEHEEGHEDILETSQIVDLKLEPPTVSIAESLNKVEATRDSTSDDIFDYPHFKIHFTAAGIKEYVCCINGKDNHYKTALLISMKKHVQTKHSEVWDGYCFMCKVIVTPQGNHNFKDCFQHYIERHMDDFPILEPVAATPEVVQEDPSAKLQNFIKVRPMCRLISNDTAPDELAALPKIESVVSLGANSTEESVPSPGYSTVPGETPPEIEEFKYEEVQAEVMSKKHRAVLDTMLDHKKLVHIYKCAGRYCTFTTDSADEALTHASTHQRVGGVGSLTCAYCDFDCSGNAIDLVMHVFKSHGTCPYACAHCFYRAACSPLVAAHAGRAHALAANEKQALVITSKLAAPVPEKDSSMLPREAVVRLYVCHSCKFRTYAAGMFCEHLLQRHSSETKHPCNFCSESLPSPAELIQHLKVHDLNLYQCTWCIHGADTESSLLNHASQKHPHKPPQAYLRLITNKDGSSEFRVLPLACFTKIKVNVTEVTPAATNDNPVREAERSIELEKLIGLSNKMIETNTNKLQSEIQTAITHITPEESPPLDRTRAVAVCASTATPPAAPTTPATLDHAPVTSASIIKPEPVETPKKVSRDTIICLDSDEEDARENVISLSDDESSVTVATPHDVSSTTLSTLYDASSAIGAADNNASSAIVATPDNALSSTVTAPDNALSSTVVKPDIASSLTAATASIASPVTVVTPVIASSTSVATHENPLKMMKQEKLFVIVELDHLFKCPNCLGVYRNVGGFKKHVRSCCNQIAMSCAHCGIAVADRNELVTHYQQDHSSSGKNFCGLCDESFSNLTLVKVHMKKVHKVSKHVVTSSVNKSLTLDYTVRPGAADKLAPKRKISADSPESTTKLARYGPADVGRLPVKSILEEAIHCSLCEYNTKVRRNMVRHLLLHAESQPVPQTAPVNPVPHLEANEKHFDKMLNLASSSIATRAPEKQRPDSAPGVSLLIPAEAATRYPKYVPERQRLTCGAKDCSYISLDEEMLRRHWDTLHAGSNDFRCVHCPPYQHLDTTRPLSAARVVGHLKMHDSALYACSDCAYYHHRRQQLDKHAAEVHGSRSRVVVVREPAAAGPAAPAAAPTMDLKPWQCGLCSFKSMLRPEVVEHCAEVHQSKMQFKCAYCPFKTSAIENITKHQANSHSGRREDIFYFYYREGSVPEPEVGPPRWARQRQTLGLGTAVKTEAETAASPTGPERPPSAPPRPASNPKPTVDLGIVKTEVEDLPEDGEEWRGAYGEYCEPNGLRHKCPLCGLVLDGEDVLRSHLYEELNYRRWACGGCSYKAFHITGLNDHVASEHRGLIQELLELPPDTNIEKWVTGLLQHQRAAIQKNKDNLVQQKILTVQLSNPSTSAEASDNSVNKSVKEKYNSATDKTSCEFSAAELEKAFGHFGTSNSSEYCCPKCNFTSKDEAAMRDHLEGELTKIRWCCSHCTDSFQTYHEAQFHCKSHAGHAARPLEAVRDSRARAAWLDHVVQQQKIHMKHTSEILRPDSDATLSPENSLLVVRYEESLPTDESGKRKKPDSVADKLTLEDRGKKKPVGDKCPHCDYRSRYRHVMKDHIFRHFNLKPYQCTLCNYSGFRNSIHNHLVSKHTVDTPSKFIKLAELPDRLPGPVGPSRVKKNDDDATKVVCLYCENFMTQSEAEKHTHNTTQEKLEFGKKGDVVVICCICHILKSNSLSFQEHHNTCHPNEQANYAYFKLLHDTKEIKTCGYCNKKFRFVGDLRVHHNVTHPSLQLKYTTTVLASPKDDSIDKSGSEASTSLKRVAKKSTSKLPGQTVAKKSTTKLPFMVYDESELSSDEFSYYGKKPSPLSPENVASENFSNIFEKDAVVLLKDVVREPYQ